MPRYLFSTMFCCLLLGAQLLPGQITFDSNSSSTAPSGLQPSTPGIILGSPSSPNNPLFAPPQAEDPFKSGGPSPPSWSDPYGGASGYGGPMYGPLPFRIRPGMTREEIVRKQAEQEMWKRLEWEERMSRIRTEVEAKQNLQRGLLGLQGLFNEPDSYVPQVLGGYNPTELTPSLSGDAPPLVEENSATAPKSPQKNAEVPDTPLREEDPIDLELRKRRTELEKQQDSEQKQRDLDALKKREDSRRRWLLQQAEAERGALFFDVPAGIRLSPQRLREGWCNLFDGRTFFGWRAQQEGHYGGGRFTIKNGEIRSDPRHPGLLYTTSQFGDSTVMFEYQASEDAEAYLLLRTSPDPQDLHSSCYAVVLHSNDFTRPEGTVLGRHRMTAEQLEEAKKRTQGADPKRALSGSRYWSRIKAQFDGSRLHVSINRDEPNTLFDSAPLGYGYVGLLVTKGDVRFRNMYWQPGSPMSLFDPINPDKFWRFRKEAVQLQTTREASMQLTGGPGVFESKQTFDNFVLQFEYNIAFNFARSGLFFRSTPRKEQSGYEISIQNFPTRSDRDEIVGVDAGAFRGVKNGRYVRPQDQKWNHMTLLVVDRQFQTWINGIPVCEMSDRRPASNDSEAGPFLLPGTLQFLAPKPGTSVDFRNIRITPIPPRHKKMQSFEDRTKSTWEELSKARKERENQELLDKKMATGTGEKK